MVNLPLSAWRITTDLLGLALGNVHRVGTRGVGADLDGLLIIKAEMCDTM